MSMRQEWSLCRCKSDASSSAYILDATTRQMTSMPNTPVCFIKHGMDEKVAGPEKPPVRPKPAYLKHLFNVGAFVRRNRDSAWSRRVKIALVADLLQGRCKAADSVLTVFNGHFEKVLYTKVLELGFLNPANDMSLIKTDTRCFVEVRALQ